MSAVWVRRDEATRGSLPSRCARTGHRCMTRYRHPVGDLPATTEWATWTGMWPRGGRDPAAKVVLPLLPGRHRAAVLLRRLRDVSIAIVPVGLLLMALTGPTLAGRLANALTVGAVLVHLAVAVVGWATTVEIRADRSGEWVRLSGVHPEFIAATEAVTTRPDTPPLLPETVPKAQPAHGTAGEPLES
jgi:hypothetical protein